MTFSYTCSRRWPSIPQHLEKEFYIYYGEDYEDQQDITSVTELPMGRRNSEQSRFNHKSNNNKVPKDVTKVLIHPCVKVIPNGTFSKCERLQEVQFGFLSSDLVTTGGFDGQAEHVISDDDDPLVDHPSRNEGTNGTIPLSDYESHLEIIGESAFSHCVALKHIALPRSLKWIQKSAFEGCLTLLSVELCQGLIKIDARAFGDCYSLKNVAIPNTVETIVGESVVTIRNYNQSANDLAENDNADKGDSLEDPLIRSLRKRFEKLPLHHLCHYFHQVYPDHLPSLQKKFEHLPVQDLVGDTIMEEMAIVKLVDKAIAESVEACATDAFGMTPLHIIACLARPNPKLLQILLHHIYANDDDSSSSNGENDVFSFSVLTKDSWGNYPIHYAVRCNAPLEIVQLLIDAQLAHHGSENASLTSASPEQPLHLRHRRKEPPYWKGLLDLACNLASLPLTKFLIESSIKDRVEDLQCPAWKQDVLAMIQSYQDEEEQAKGGGTPSSVRIFLQNQEQQQQPKALTAPRSRQQLIKAVEKRLEWYKFQEPLSLLELAAWKAKLTSETTSNGDIIMVSEDADTQQQQSREACRIHCGAELVTIHVLEFLGSFEDQQLARWKKKKRSIPLLPTPNPWATVPALRHL